MASSTKTLKVLALLADIIYAICGFAVISVAIYILIKLDQFNTAAFIILAFGIVVLLTAAFGALGALRESIRLSKTYVGILIVLIVLQLLAISIFWIFKTSLLINVDKMFDQLWHEQPVPIRPGNATQIATLEKWLECCGNAGPSDYILPPYSCYTDNNRLNLDGCRQKFLDYISDGWTGVNILGLVLVLVEVVCGVLAYVLANSIQNRWRRSKYYPK